MISPRVEIRPTRPAAISTNHKSSPSLVMPTGAASGVGNGWMTHSPSTVMRPIPFAWLRVNHSAPSGPAVIADGKPPVVGSANSVISPPPSIRPMRSLFISVNHTAPSGPAVMP